MEAENTAGRTLVIADLGKRKRKDVKKIRARGDGPLLDDVNELVARLEREGQIPAGASVVVAIVEKKQRKPLRLGW